MTVKSNHTALKVIFFLTFTWLFNVLNHIAVLPEIDAERAFYRTDSYEQISFFSMINNFRYAAFFKCREICRLISRNSVKWPSFLPEKHCIIPNRETEGANTRSSAFIPLTYNSCHPRPQRNISAVPTVSFTVKTFRKTGAFPVLGVGTGIVFPVLIQCPEKLCFSDVGAVFFMSEIPCFSKFPADITRLRWNVRYLNFIPFWRCFFRKKTSQNKIRFF